MKLETKTKEWVNAGLISQQQADQIISYQTNKASSTWVTTGFMILGAIIIGLGVISMVAANWEKIPGYIKLTNNFILLTGVAIAIFVNFNVNKQLKFDLLILTFIILCMASIGLIGQVFHTSGRYYEIALFWSMITFAIASTTQRFIVWLIWFAVVLTGIASYLDPHTGEINLFNNTNEMFVSMTFFLTFVAFMCSKITNNQGFAAALRVWCVIFLLGSLMYNELKVLGSYARQNDPGFNSGINFNVIITAILATISIISNIAIHQAQKVIALSIVGLLIFSLLLANSNYFPDLVMAVTSLLILSLMAMLMASMGRKILYNVFLALMFVRFLVLYFQALGGLAATGAGLMIAGIIIVFLAINWKRYGNKLLRKIEGWTDEAK